MSIEFERNLEKYAELIVKVGLNLQPGQRLLIGPPLWGSFGVNLELVSLIRLIATKAYQAGARLVDVMWSDSQLQLIRLKHAPHDSFEEFPMWRAAGAIETAKAADPVGGGVVVSGLAALTESDGGKDGVCGLIYSVSARVICLRWVHGL
jgi:leucyl aminopeptidase (aminopeptidase T)